MVSKTILDLLLDHMSVHALDAQSWVG